MFIYLTTNNINEKKYIGMCTREDSSYVGSGVLLKKAINKHGKENFSRTILQNCASFEELCDAEKYWIDFYDAVNSDEFYNLIEGGLGGNSEQLKDYWNSLSSEQRKTIRNWKPHFKLNPPSGEKNPMYGKSTSKYVKAVWDNRTEDNKKEIAAKVSKTRKEKGVASGINNPMYGRSVVKENNLRWYTDGTKTIYVSEGSQPKGFKRGRTIVKSK
jgi:group I intron endonuclease